MITLYDPRPFGGEAASIERDTPSDRTTRLSPPPTGEAFWLWREQRRYEFAAEKLREAGMVAYADLYDRFAEQARLEVLALAKADQRIAALDEKLARKAGAA